MIEKKVKETIKKYKLADKKEKIIVACSGGKDSTTALYLLKKFGYNVEALLINLSMGKWFQENVDNLKNFCEKNKINLHIVDIKDELGCSICYARSVIQEKKKLSNCMICGVIKRWLLNKKARELGAKKLATGHNLDDEAQSIMMNIILGNPEIGINMGPKVGTITDKKLVQRIKPLYFLTNNEIKKYTKQKKFKISYSSCPCSEHAFRRLIYNELNKIEKTNPKVKMNIVKSFLKILPEIRKKYKVNENLEYCEKCGEPSRNKICKRCILLETSFRT